MNIKLFLCCVLCASYSFAENIEDVLRRNQKSAVLMFPSGDAGKFSLLQKAALQGDLAAQEQIPAMMLGHLQSVYGVLSKRGGLLFSVRRLNAGYDQAENNYVMNLNEFFEATTDDVRVEKDSFELHTKAGASFPVRYLRYKSSEKAVKVTDTSGTQWIQLVDLTDSDRRFVESALADEIFESEGSFEISTEDSRNGGVRRGEKGKIHHINKETGEELKGAFVSTASKGIGRKIILVNNGPFPLKNLTVEYQSFAEQTIMRLPKYFPSDYRCVGFVAVKSLEPGERKEIELKLPATVDAKQETIHSGDYEFYRVIPSDCNQRSEGRMNGVRIKVHRFTPYGERLVREYQSTGVPSTEWINVAPTEKDIR